MATPNNQPEQGTYTAPSQNKPPNGALVVLSKLFLGPIIFLGFFALLGLWWVQRYFSDVTLDMMVMQLRMPLSGTGGGFFLSFFVQVLLPSLAGTVALVLLGHFIRKSGRTLAVGKRTLFPNRVLSMVLAVVFAATSLGQVSATLGLPAYLANRRTPSSFIEKNYVAPSAGNIQFPAQKRNLIYIYLESMESTFLSAAQGGQMPQSVIPELHEIAQNNVSFSDTENIGGAVPLPGMGVTSAGMVAQTSGLPLFLPEGWAPESAREVFVSSAVVLGDILAGQGYAQYLMVGSDARFGARDQYYRAHGGATVLDLFTARDSGIIPQDYDNHFWGMEDSYLYAYAKQQLPQIAQQDEPFCFTLLTSDTHFPDGYVCSLCREEFGDQYSDVLACASRQVADFLVWLSQQDFYQNTTVILAGDHLSMNAHYFERNNLDVNRRRVYNAFINPAAGPPQLTKGRMFAAVDLFPTTLAALGAEISGDRLGLGTNLFSDKPTLLEMYGYDVVNEELFKKPENYDTYFNT